MRIVFNYYKILLSINLPFSYIFKFIYGTQAFLLTFCTFGLLLSAFFFELYYKQRYYFYYNKGFSKFKLIGFSFLGNLLFAALLFFILKILVL